MNSITSKGSMGPADQKVLQRLGFVYLRYVGYDLKEACKTAKISVQTGYNWQNSWNESGIQSLSPNFAGGRPSRMDDAQKAKLTDFVRRAIPSTAEAQRFMRDEFGIDYSEKQTHTILKSMGFSHVSRKQIHGRVPEKAQDEKRSRMRWVPKPNDDTDSKR